jgi:toxin ParE1/3/4
VTYTVYFHPDAEGEINEAAEFLNRESPGLGTTFLGAVERAVEEIAFAPEAGQLIRTRVRRKLVRKFPYSIVFAVRGTLIRILAVAHQKRRPYYWRSRR